MSLVNDQVLPERLAKQFNVLQQYFEGRQYDFELVDVVSLSHSLADTIKIKFMFVDQITRRLSSVPHDRIEWRQRIDVMQPVVDSGQRANN